MPYEMKILLKSLIKSKCVWKSFGLVFIESKCVTPLSMHLLTIFGRSLLKVSKFRWQCESITNQCEEKEVWGYLN